MIDELHKKIKQNKPKINDKSVSAYVSALLILYNNITSKSPSSLDEIYKLFFTKVGMRKVLAHLEKVKYSLRKSRLAAILSLCENGTKGEKEICDVYRDRMMKDIRTHEEKEDTQEKSEKQEKAWKSLEELKQKRSELEGEFKTLIKKKASSITRKEYDTLQQFVISSIYLLIPPRRIKDYTHFVWKRSPTEGDTEKQGLNEMKNYLENNDGQSPAGSVIVFNTYKTAKTYGEQRVEVPKELADILKKWKSKKNALGIKSEYVFTDRDGRPFSQPNFTRELNRIFGKGISVSMLRHIYITDDVLKDMPEIERLKDKAEDLGHSVSQMMRYKKKE
jgi:hypothetical protein